MIIKDVLTALETSQNPVAKLLHTGAQFKVLVIGFKSGMLLAEHKTNVQAKLIVLNGKVSYQSEPESVVMEQYDELEIPVDVPHSVRALVDSLCLLTQG